MQRDIMIRISSYRAMYAVHERSMHGDVRGGHGRRVGGARPDGHIATSTATRTLYMLTQLRSSCTKACQSLNGSEMCLLGV